MRAAVSVFTVWACRSHILIKTLVGHPGPEEAWMVTVCVCVCVYKYVGGVFSGKRLLWLQL